MRDDLGKLKMFIRFLSVRLRVVDQYDIAGLDSLPEKQLLAIMRPIEIEQGSAVELRHLVRRAAVQWLVPNIRSVLPILQVGQLTAVTSPSDGA